MKLTRLIDLLNRKEITISKTGKLRKHPKSRLTNLEIALYLYDQSILGKVRCVVCNKPLSDPFSFSEWKLKYVCVNKQCQSKFMIYKRKQKQMILPIWLKTKYGRLKWLIQNGCFDKNKNVKTICLESLNLTIQELYDWVNDITDIPKCIICKTNNVSFNSWKKGYNKVCSDKRCQIEYNKQKLKEKYNVDRPNLIPHIRQSIINKQRYKQFNSLKQLLNVRNIELLDDNDKFIKYHYDIKYNFRCTKCNTYFEDYLHPQVLPWCPKCGKLNYGSKLEQIAKEWLDEKGVNYIRHYKINKKFEVDFYIPELNIAIEVNGLYYHFGYHDKSKSLYLSKLGIQLLHLYEDTIIFEPEKAKSILYSKLSIYDYVLYARNTFAIKVSQKEVNNFHKKYHLSGSSKSHISFALISDDSIVSVISFKIRNHKAIIDRYTIKHHYKIVGGFGKLLKYSLKEILKEFDISEIDTYLHLELNNIPEKSVYHRYGFDLIGLNDDFYVIYNNKRYHRLFANKQNLLKIAKEKEIEIDTEMSQQEIMYKLGIKTLHLGSWKFSKKITDFDLKNE